MDENPGLDVRPALCCIVGAVLIMLALSAYAWNLLPADARIATHWNMRGEADGFSSKSVGLFMLPTIVLAIFPFTLLLIRLDPRKSHVAQSAKFLNVVFVALAVMMTSMHAATVGVALGFPIPVGEVTLSFTGLLLLVIGNYTGKVRSNFFMGVRTPWTLSSELSWNKTNRLFGRMFTAVGSLTLGFAWISSYVAIGALLGGTLASVLVAVVYSYRVWKRDPSLHPAGGPPRG